MLSVSLLSLTGPFLHPAEFRIREQTVLATFNDLQGKAGAMMDVISNPAVVSALRQDKLQNLAYLKDNHNVCRSAVLSIEVSC